MRHTVALIAIAFMAAYRSAFLGGLCLWVFGVSWGLRLALCGLIVGALVHDSLLRLVMSLLGGSSGGGES